LALEGGIMSRVLPTLVITKAPQPEIPPESYAPGGWLEVVCTLAIVAMFVISMALGAPEPVDCGVDRNAPTLEGCQP
jgi:hypothetical protein